MESAALRRRMFAAFYLNIFVTSFVVALVTVFHDDTSTFLRYGWHNNFTVLGIHIDTKERYWCLVAVLGLLEALDVFINDTIFPYVNNNVRDNNVTHIAEFTRREIQLLTNGTFFLTSLKYTFYVIVSISQVDVALIRVFIGETACIFTTSIQLSGKTFRGATYAAVMAEEVL
jgi:hypothetical protein